VVSAVDGLKVGISGIKQGNFDITKHLSCDNDFTLIFSHVGFCF